MPVLLLSPPVAASALPGMLGTGALESTVIGPLDASI